MKHIFKSLALVLAIVLAMTLSLSVLAEDSSAVSTDSVAESSDVSSETSSTASSEASSEAVSDASSAASSVTESSSATTGSTDSANKSEPQETAKNFPWARVITLIVIVVLIVVMWVLTKTETAIGQKLKKFFKEYWSEIKKVSWSSPKDTAKATGVVLVFLIVAAVAIGVLDFAFTKIIQLIAEIFN